MNFRTEVNPKKSKYQINHNDKIITIGSCFSENIGKQFNKNAFNTLINPFGVLYNPFSIKTALELILKNKQFTETDLIYHNEQWHSFYHHSDFSCSEKTTILTKINESISYAHDFFKKTDYLMITFGSSYVYEYKKNQTIVSNCHKIPEKEFHQFLLELDDIYNNWLDLIKELKSFNPELKLVFTVSPIRYLKYENEANSVSKAILILLINKLKKSFEFIDYFPAYEIMMDDLRDYRFYNKDMIHPSEVAIEYIWNKFSDTFFSTNTIKLISEIKKITQASSHKAFNSNSEAHQKFLKTNLQKIEELEKNNANLKLSEYKLCFEKQLDHI